MADDFSNTPDPGPAAPADAGAGIPMDSGPAPQDFSNTPDQQPQQSDPGMFQRMLDYFHGAKAMPPEHFDALKNAGRSFDDSGQPTDETPTQANQRALERAAEMGPEAATGAVQHLRSQYEIRRAQAGRTAEEGHYDVAAKDATDAFANVPDGHEVTVLPHRDGLMAVVNTPSGDVQKLNFTGQQFAQAMKNPSTMFDPMTDQGTSKVLSKFANPDDFGIGNAGEGAKAVGGALEKGAQAVGGALQQGGQAVGAQGAAKGGGSENAPLGKLEDQTPTPTEEELRSQPPGKPPQSMDEALQRSNREPGVGEPRPPEDNRAANEFAARADREWAAYKGQSQKEWNDTLQRARERDKYSGSKIDTAGTLQQMQWERTQPGLRTPGQRNFPSGYYEGERLPNGARRVADAHDVPPGWETHRAEDLHLGWIAAPPGLKVEPRVFTLRNEDGQPVKVHGNSLWEPERIRYQWGAEMGSHGGRAGQELFKPPGGITSEPSNSSRAKRLDSDIFAQKENEAPDNRTDQSAPPSIIHNIQGGRGGRESFTEIGGKTKTAFDGSPIDLPAHEVSLNPQTPGTRGRGGGAGAATQEAQAHRQQRHDVYTALRKQTAPLTEDQQAFVDNYEREVGNQYRKEGQPPGPLTGLAAGHARVFKDGSTWTVDANGRPKRVR